MPIYRHKLLFLLLLRNADYLIRCMDAV